MRSLFEKILKGIPIEIKQWIFDNPDCYKNKDFKRKCPFSARIGKRRYAEVRWELIESLPIHIRKTKNFANRYSKPRISPKTKLLHRYILAGGGTPRTCYNKFVYQMRYTNSDDETKALAKKISKDAFNRTVLKLRKRGMIPPKKR